MFPFWEQPESVSSRNATYPQRPRPAFSAEEAPAGGRPRGGVRRGSAVSRERYRKALVTRGGASDGGRANLPVPRTTRSRRSAWRRSSAHPQPLRFTASRRRAALGRGFCSLPGGWRAAGVINKCGFAARLLALGCGHSPPHEAAPTANQAGVGWGDAALAPGRSGSRPVPRGPCRYAPVRHRPGEHARASRIGGCRVQRQAASSVRGARGASPPGTTGPPSPDTLVAGTRLKAG